MSIIIRRTKAAARIYNEIEQRKKYNATDYFGLIIDACLQVLENSHRNFMSQLFVQTVARLSHAASRNCKVSPVL
jgi:hypothetical protein